MKKLVCSLAVAAALAGLAPAGSALAQKPEEHQQVSAEQALPQIHLTPEMLLYLQEMRRYEDPRQAVRRNAEQKAGQRRARLASMQWYGYSNQRPQASPMPFMGTYSPVWTGNSWDPYRWVGHGYPHTTLRIEYLPLR
jgi:hypothetical protein